MGKIIENFENYMDFVNTAKVSQSGRAGSIYSYGSPSTFGSNPRKYKIEPKYAKKLAILADLCKY